MTFCFTFCIPFADFLLSKRSRELLPDLSGFQLTVPLIIIFIEQDGICWATQSVRFLLQTVELKLPYDALKYNTCVYYIKLPCDASLILQCTCNFTINNFTDLCILSTMLVLGSAHIRRIINTIHTKWCIVSSEAKTMCSGGLKCSSFFCPQWLINYAKQLYGLLCCTKPVASVHGVSTS